MLNGNISPDVKVISTDPEYRPLNRKITEAAGNWTTRLMEQEFEEL
ncbi:DUF6809 family protein [Paenibacillus graminis]